MTSSSGTTKLYDPTKHNYMNAIHPVIFAMFGPKIHLFEHRMLLANLPNIIRARYNKESVQTKPDYELLYDLITDPNDVVCDRTSPLKDLKNRCVLQDALQRCVLNMRMYRFYETCSPELSVAIESCKLMNIENPELLYSGDESVYFRRIINTFSLRPTVVRTDDSVALNQAPFQQFASTPLVSSLNIMTLRLPPQQSSEESRINLTSAMTQSQFFIENGRFVSKNQQIIYSRNVLLFNILRKYNRIFMNKLFAPFNFQNLPFSVSALEKINKTNVASNYVMTIGVNETPFFLRSVLISEMQTLEFDENSSNEVVIGSKAYVFDYLTAETPAGVYEYSPYKKRELNQEVITKVLDFEQDDLHRVEQQSTIYIYATTRDNQPDQLGIEY
jgi:hypothetical protein